MPAAATLFAALAVAALPPRLWTELGVGWSPFGARPMLIDFSVGGGPSPRFSPGISLAVQHPLAAWIVPGHGVPSWFAGAQVRSTMGPPQSSVRLRATLGVGDEHLLATGSWHFDGARRAPYWGVRLQLEVAAQSRPEAQSATAIRLGPAVDLRIEWLSGLRRVHVDGGEDRLSPLALLRTLDLGAGVVIEARHVDGPAVALQVLGGLRATPSTQGPYALLRVLFRYEQPGDGP